MVPACPWLEEVDQGVAPPGVVVRPLLATAVVEVLVSALPYRLERVSIRTLGTAHATPEMANGIPLRGWGP